MRRLALSVLAAALLAPSAANAAAADAYRTGPHLQRPALAGDRVVAAEHQRSGRVRALSVPVAGGAPTTLSEAISRPASAAGISYGASSAQVLLRRWLEGRSAEIFSGPPSGPVSPVERCSPGPEFVPAPAVGDGVAAWAGADCREGRIRIRTAAGATQTVDAGGFIHALAAGGPFVAWLVMERSPTPAEPVRTRLVVHDTRTGAPAYSTTVPPATELDVQADGTAALSTFAPATDRICAGGGPRARILYYTRAEPVEHEVPGAVACEGSVRVAGDRIAYSRTLGGRGRMLTVTTLDGVTTREVARLDAVPPQASFDWDGERLAWSQVRCRESLLRTRLAGDADPPEPAVACPVRVGNPRLARDRTIHVRIGCPNGCRSLARQGLTIVSPRFLHVWRRTRTHTVYRPYRGFDIAPGRTVTLRLGTTRHQRALIRRKRRVSVRLKVNAQNVYLPRIARTLRAGR